MNTKLAEFIVTRSSAHIAKMRLLAVLHDDRCATRPHLEHRGVTMVVTPAYGRMVRP